MIDISDKIKNILEQLPELPGIYKMIDARKNIIYIGKSKCLKKRVKTYFADNPKWEKVNRMVRLIDNIEFIVTDTHLEAMLLECSLIKSIQPIFNSQMKNDRRYVFLKIEDYNRHNALKVSSTREENSYGPFRNKYMLYDIIDSLKNLYPIIKTNDTYDFEYHLFPVPMDKEIFQDNQKSLLHLFSNGNNFDIFINILNNKMQKESSLCNFESAIMYRNIIQNMEYLKTAVNKYKSIMTADIFIAIPIQKGYKLFFISGGNIILKEKFSEMSEIKSDIKDDFIQRGIKSLESFSMEMDEKSHMDYRDILYSEIINHPDEYKTVGTDLLV
jgi:excinuclease ABC subunit C